ncbi:hypothetical protein ACIQH6_09150 [Micromonospora orduensis]|uniref:hypothetical protein n=1 Tax=Micromonospora orduensis TaxID=1420891 RepID=UPI003823CF4C
MAFRTWGRLLLTALGVSVLAGAGQLGVAYGFGIVRLTGAFTGTTVNQWPAQLVWVGWFAANAAVAGAVLTGRLARRDTPAASTGRHLAIGGAAALGATAVAPLCMQPARAAELISVDPVWAVGICAILGAVIGAGAAIAVLLRPELGWNMAAVAGAVWLVALISVLPSLGTTGPLPTVRLGVLEPSWLDDDAAQRLSLVLLPITALLAGAATAGFSRWRGQVPLISGATGVAGPVLVAFAYLTAGPGDAVDRYQTTPYYGALIAVLAGALGAAAAALLRWPVRASGTDGQVIEPTTILRPLPAGPDLPGARSTTPADDLDATGHASDEPTSTGRSGLGTIAGEPTTARRTGPDAHTADAAVRTVPAHWDWPGTTASGQHGPATPDAPRPTAATSLTAPTREPGAADQAPTTASPLAGLDSSLASDLSDRPLESATGPTVPPAEGPSTGDGTAAGRPDTGTDAGDPAPTEPATTERGTTSASLAGGTSSSGGSSAEGGDATSATPAPKPRRIRKAKSTPSASDLDADGTPSTTAAAPTDPATTVPAPTGTGATAPPAATAATATPTPTGTDATTTPADATTSAATTSAAAMSADATSAAMSADATPAGATSAGAGRARKAARSGSAADGARPAGRTARTGPDAPTDLDAPAATPQSTAAAGTPRDAAGQEATTASATAPAANASEAVASEPERETVTSPRTATDRTGTEDGFAAPLFGAESAGDAQPDRWTPTPPAWPVTSGRTTAAQAEDTASTVPDAETSSDPVEWTPRPRHRASLPDLSRATSWDAFNTTRSAGLAGVQNGPTDASRKPSTETPASTDAAASTNTTRPTDTTTPAETDTAADDPTSGSTAPAERGGSRGALDRAAGRWRRATGTSTRSSGLPTSEPAEAPEPVSPVVPGQAESPVDSPANADPAAGDESEQPARRGRLGGLFRRNRSRADEETRPMSDAEEPLPAQDEEFVDWVAGLGKPVADNEPDQENGRRSLRSTGRHHRD